MAEPTYPGYKARECNGCGLCCLTVPCPISRQYRLWKNGKCSALVHQAGRYWCKVIIEPRMVSLRFRDLPREEREDAIGIGYGCDHRAAYSIAAALALLEVRNLWDELQGYAEDTYPRAVVFHNGGRQYMIHLSAREAEPTIEPVIAGLAAGVSIPLSTWRKNYPDVQ